MVEDHVQEDVQPLRFVRDVALDHAFTSYGVQHREVELLLGGVQVDEQVVYLVQHFVGASVLAVYLVDDHDDLLVLLKSLLEHEARLGQGAFGCVHKQHGAVGHGQGAFHLAAEVGVAGGVDDVDLHAFPDHGAVFGRNGDAAFALPGPCCP